MMVEKGQGLFFISKKRQGAFSTSKKGQGAILTFKIRQGAILTFKKRQGAFLTLKKRQGAFLTFKKRVGRGALRKTQNMNTKVSIVFSEIGWYCLLFIHFIQKMTRFIPHSRVLSNNMAIFRLFTEKNHEVPRSI